MKKLSHHQTEVKLFHFPGTDGNGIIGIGECVLIIVNFSLHRVDISTSSARRQLSWFDRSEHSSGIMFAYGSVEGDLHGLGRHLQKYISRIRKAKPSIAVRPRCQTGSKTTRH